MKMKKTLFTLAAVASVGLVLTGCGESKSSSKSSSSSKMSSSSSEKTMSKKDMKETKGDKSMDMNMQMKHKMALPTDLTAAKNPKYKVGSEVKLTADHMKGMKGAKAKVTGAYDSPLYVIDYKPTDGKAEVKNHEFVTKNQLKADKPGAGLKKGEKVTVEADHMKGMKGAKGKIVKVCDGPAYAVTFTPTNGGKEYVNHQWVSQTEMEKE
ncbi:YdhK family protein [Fructilactobacillus fructivorans]|nr:YdhK family protein [Fructilactobacillus fructivorans]KRK57429.1 hypothetical protein FC73_GL000974 [Fructilactobacillus fructivorans]KRN12425.1 hypothetical protein IV37_GL001202 [Fructilactobacillus fructivorans]KRN41082.1 hypothetical protein IV51_GL000827 [Fructilactobacillus fructivorans]KRN42932.1 hypothetical protein IV48_GL000960 [Fructilactobacillus fructivorans]